MWFLHPCFLYRVFFVCFLSVFVFLLENATKITTNKLKITRSAFSYTKYTTMKSSIDLIFFVCVSAVCLNVAKFRYVCCSSHSLVGIILSSLSSVSWMSSERNRHKKNEMKVSENERQHISKFKNWNKANDEIIFILD